MEREAQSHQREIKRLYGKCKLEGIPTIEEFNEFQFQNTDDKNKHGEGYYKNYRVKSYWYRR